MTQITSNIWVGSLDDAYNDKIICKCTHVLNVASELNLIPRINHVYAKYGIDDDDYNSNICSIIPQCVNFIDLALSNGGSIFIHCLEGVSRSPCIVMAYIYYRHGYTVDNAYKHIKQLRPCIDIFPLYWTQLKILEINADEPTENIIKP